MSTPKDDLYDPRFKDLSILIVSESVHLTGIASRFLFRYGFRNIKRAPNGKAAFDLLSNDFFDFTLVDEDMQETSGISFAKLIRRSPDSPNTELPMILMMGNAIREIIFEVRDAGANDVIGKPLNPQVLFQKLLCLYDCPRKHVNEDNFTGPDRRRRDVNIDPQFERRKMAS